jgi:hypothetical protein
VVSERKPEFTFWTGLGPVVYFKVPTRRVLPEAPFEMVGSRFDHRQRQRLLRPDADNDAMIGPGVVGQIPIGSNLARAGTMEADPATIPI